MAASFDAGACAMAAGYSGSSAACLEAVQCMVCYVPAGLERFKDKVKKLHSCTSNTIILLDKQLKVQHTCAGCRAAVRYSVSSPQASIAADLRWKRVEDVKATMPKDSAYQNVTAQQLQQLMPIRVISLARAKERRAAMIKGLQAAGG